MKNYHSGRDRMKPLILKGARQTGKTYILSEFGKNEFRRTHYVNFQKDRNASEIFGSDLTPRNILTYLEFYLDTAIDTRRDMIFFDEIQDAARALTSLKYFCEEPELSIVCAGSLLGVTQTDEPFPVGKVTFLNLYPMSFEEFLFAAGDEKAYDILRNIKYPQMIPRVAHDHLMKRLREYFVTGGLPEVVRTYCLNQENKLAAFEKVRKKQSDLITGYMSDFSKYSGKVRANEIHAVFESVPAQLARENKKFRASGYLVDNRQHSGEARYPSEGRTAVHFRQIPVSEIGLWFVSKTADNGLC